MNSENQNSDLSKNKKVSSNVIIPSKFMKYQIWRLIASVFISTNILQIILAFLVWFRYASMLEKLSGTVKYAIYFFINSICIFLFFHYVTSTLLLNLLNPKIITE